MTSAFPLDGRSPPSQQKQHNRQAKPQTSEAKVLRSETSEIKQRQLTSEEAEELAFQELQELKANFQNLAKEEAQKANQQAKERGEVAQPQIQLRPSNRMGLAQLKVDRQNLWLF